MTFKRRIVLVAMVLLAFTGMVFAQNAKNTKKDVKPVVLTESDVKAFIKNYKAIEKAVDAYDDDFDDDDVTLLNYERIAQEAVNKLESIFTKNGISGPNATAKYYVLMQGVAIFEVEQEIMADKATYDMMLKMGIDPAQSYRALVSDENYKVMKKFDKQLAALED